MIGPGVHLMPAADYHADLVAEQPSLSSSIANVLCSSSPAHARAAHPRLNPEFARVEEEKFDVGTACHALLLEGDAGVEVIDAPDWRTNAAKEARDEARAAGRTPLLAKHWAAVEAMAVATRAQLDAIDADPPLFTDGKAEQTLVWDDGGVTCRARLDWLRDDLAAIDDYKSAHDANPENWSRRALFNNGYDLQAAFYLRGLERLTGARAVWRWVVQEKTPPYALAVVTPGAGVLAVAEAKVDYAIRLWRECLRSGRWPGYTTAVVQAELPPWSDDARWLVDDYRDAA